MKTLTIAGVAVKGPRSIAKRSAINWLDIKASQFMDNCTSRSYAYSGIAAKEYEALKMVISFLYISQMITQDEYNEINDELLAAYRDDHKTEQEADHEL